MKMPRCPEGLSAHNFKVCDTHGGGAFRHWCMLMYHKGVFLGFEDHNWVIYASSDPTAKWSRGCQESRAHGDPMPQCLTAKLLSWNQIPDAVKPIVAGLVEEAVVIARSMIKSKENVDTAERRREQDKHDAERQGIVDAWSANPAINTESRD